MRLNKVIFSCEMMDYSSFDVEKIKKIDVIFEKGVENPVLIIECATVKIEDRGLPINCDEILKEVGKIDFESENDFLLQSEYSGKKWRIILNDKEYSGAFDDPYYVTQLKKVLK